MAELDWRNPDDYAYLNDYSLHEWAWEFLRRNPKYREAYFALEAMATKGILQEIQHDRAKHEKFWALHHAATGPWALRMPANPRFPYRDALPNFTQQAGVKMPPSWEAPDPEPGDLWPGYPHTVVLQFDLHYSVDVLIDIAAERLRRFSQHVAERYGYQPIAPSPTAKKQLRVRQFPLYVRILDAELAGASIGEIGRVLFPNRADQRSNVKAVRETARKMAREEYRELLLLPPHPPDV